MQCPLLLYSLLLCSLGVPWLECARDSAFINYSEGQKATSTGKSGCGDTNAACEDWSKNGECSKNAGFMNGACPVSCKQCTAPELNPGDFVDKTLVLVTEFGEIHIDMLWDIAPRTAALIMDLAQAGPKQQRACRFYRNEEAPTAGDGPPYGLLQGSFAGMLKAPPSEGRAPPTYGYIAMITGTTEFYISLMDHTSWAGAHTVWGKVHPASIPVIEQLIQEPYHNQTHPVGTVMRMMERPKPFEMRALDSSGES